MFVFIYCPKSIYQLNKNTLFEQNDRNETVKRSCYCNTASSHLTISFLETDKLLFVLRFIALSLFNKKQACLNGRLLLSFTVSDLLRKGSHVSY